MNEGNYTPAGKTTRETKTIKKYTPNVMAEFAALCALVAACATAFPSSVPAAEIATKIREEALNINRDEPAWNANLALMPRGLAQAGAKLCVNGIPGPKFNPEDPLAAVEDRGTAEPWLLSSANGDKLGSCGLPATCVFDGMAVANGKVYISLADAFPPDMDMSRNHFPSEEK